jgi:AraC family mar-sox-rob regulon transcriptional activator
MARNIKGTFRKKDPMFDHNYFTLQSVRLKSSETWSSQREGFCFVFPKIGVGQYVNGPVAQRLVPGDILVCEGCPEGKFSVSKGGELTFFAFSLRLDHLFPLFASKEISLLRQVTDNLRAAKYFPSSTALAAKCHQLIEAVPSQTDLDHRSHLLQVAAAILKEEFRTAHQQQADVGQVEERILTVFEQLSADQLLSLTVDELAARFGCCRRHLNRLFHQYFGFSVGAMKTEMRLLKAVSLLRDANAKVINVADQCGFNHLGLFNSSFKKRFGVSPGRWRKLASPEKIRPAPGSGLHSTYALLGKGLRSSDVGTPKNGVHLARDISPLKKAPRVKSPPAMPAGVQQLPLLVYPKAVIPMRATPPC